MGMWDTFVGWGNAARKTTQQLTFDMMCYVGWHVLPYYIEASELFDAHPVLGNIWRGACKIFTQDVVPMVVAKAINQGTQSSLEEYDNPLAESIKWGVWSASSIVIFTRALEGTARAVVLTVDAGTKLAERNNKKMDQYKQLCDQGEQGHCSKLRFIQGGVRDFIAYEATGRLIANVQYLPFVGSSLAEIGSLWNSGGYVCSTIMPPCNRHLVENKQQHPAFVFAIGLHHSLMTALVTYLIQLTSRLPGDLYRNYWDADSQFSTEIPLDQYQQYVLLVAQLCLVVEMIFAADMTWPPPVAKANRYFYNPLIAFQRGVGFIFDTLAKGAKKTVPPLLRAANSDKVAWIETNVKEAWNHPMWLDPRLDSAKVVMSWLSWVMLPELLYHEGGFKDSMLGPRGSFAHDSVIGPSWNRWREAAIAVVTAMEEERKVFLVQLFNWAVKDTREGTPEETRWVQWMGKLTRITKATVKGLFIQFATLNGYSEAEALGVPIVKLINNDFIIRMLGYLRAGLEDLEQPHLPESLGYDNFSAVRSSLNAAAVEERQGLPALPPALQSVNSQTARGAISLNAPSRVEPIVGARFSAARLDVQSAPVNLTVESESSSQRVNSGNARQFLSLTSPSSKLQSVDPQALRLGLNRNSVFSPPESTQSVRLQAKSASEQAALLAQKELEERLAEAMNDLMDGTVANKAHQ